MSGEDVYSMLRRVEQDNDGPSTRGGNLMRRKPTRKTKRYKKQRGGVQLPLQLEAALKTGKMLPYIPLKAAPTFYKGFKTTTSIQRRLSRIPTPALSNQNAAIAGGAALATGLGAYALHKWRNRKKNNQQGGGLAWSTVRNAPRAIMSAYNTYDRARRLERTLNSHFIDGIDGTVGLRNHDRMMNALKTNPRTAKAILGASLGIPAALAAGAIIKNKFKRKITQTTY